MQSTPLTPNAEKQYIYKITWQVEEKGLGYIPACLAKKFDDVFNHSKTKIVVSFALGFVLIVVAPSISKPLGGYLIYFSMSYILILFAALVASEYKRKSQTVSLYSWTSHFGSMSWFDYLSKLFILIRHFIALLFIHVALFTGLFLVVAGIFINSAS